VTKDHILKINLFSDGLFEGLKQYNQEIIDICDRHKILSFGQHGNGKDESSWWFNPREIQKLHLTQTWKERGEIIYPEPNPLVYDKKFCLILHVPNYLALWLTNKLMPKHILFEDLGSGLSQVSFYLYKLGFKQFSLVENFAYLGSDLFYDFVSTTKLPYVLNKNGTKPQVTNIVGHHPYPKVIERSNELFITYQKDELMNLFDHLDGYKRLCEDSDGLSVAYAREDKYDEFMEKLNA
jgi:hypothetical protein